METEDQKYLPVEPRKIHHATIIGENYDYEYRKQLMFGDIVTIYMEDMIGEDRGLVISNDGTHIVIQMRGKILGKISFRSFWVKTGVSCGPAITDTWENRWCFYFIGIPPNFGEKVITIIDLRTDDISIESLPYEKEEENDDIQF